jgi:2-polyprenyl-3-methyl-5-hydroxy-6-metoxy-1,4-benzoquinol methylase
VRSKRVILERGLSIVGIDVREDYIRKAGRVVRETKLRTVVTLLCKSIYDPALRETFGKGTTRFDVAHFSGSLTLMSNPAEALQVAATMLQPDGQIFVTQTFQTRYVPLMKYIKPMLLRFTTIDFGQLTYEHELDAILEAADVQVQCAMPNQPRHLADCVHSLTGGREEANRRVNQQRIPNCIYAST